MPRLSRLKAEMNASRRSSNTMGLQVYSGTGRRAVDHDELLLLLCIAFAACRQRFLQSKDNFVPALPGLPWQKCYRAGDTVGLGLVPFFSLESHERADSSQLTTLPPLEAGCPCSAPHYLQTVAP